MVFDITYYVKPWFHIHRRKMRMSANSLVSYPKHRFFVNWMSFFWTYQFCFRRGSFFLVPWKTSILAKRWALWLFSTNCFQFFPKMPLLAIFDHLGVASKSTFSPYKHSFEKPWFVSRRKLSWKLCFFNSYLQEGSSPFWKFTPSKILDFHIM